jgi:hypothetical protein
MTVSVPPHSWETKRLGTWMSVVFIKDSKLAHDTDAANPRSWGERTA